MTETEWLECIAPEMMLAYLGERASPRKRRLFACACVRRIWPLLNDDRLREAVKVAEQFADGRISRKLVKKAQRVATRLREKCEAAEEQAATWKARATRAAAQAVEALFVSEEPILTRPRDIREPPDVVSTTRWARTAARAAEARRDGDAPAAHEPIRRLHSLDAIELVHEIFGNPFHAVALDRQWLHWKDGLVPKMAKLIYRKRCFRNLPILADALEEAGCNDADILNHCRAPVEHVRGCWIVDALLDRS